MEQVQTKFHTLKNFSQIISIIETNFKTTTFMNNQKTIETHSTEEKLNPAVNTMGHAYSILSSSPLFNLSLSSKELFHSNFLAWLAQHYPDFFVEICKELGCKADWSNAEWNVKREYKNFDLCITSDEKIVMVLENKVKSIPTKAQLDEYVEKLKKKKKQDVKNIDLILLSLSTSFPDKNAIEGEKKWQIRNYDHLCTAMREHMQLINNQYHKALIEDYCSFVATLHECSESWKVKDSSPFLLPNDSNRKELKELRIADLQDKIWYSQLLEKLNSRLEENNQWDVQSGMDIKKIAKDNSACLTKIFTNFGFTHVEGLLEAKIKVSQDYVLLIQIQGNKYCRAIEWIKEDQGDHNKFWEMTKDIMNKKGFSFFQFKKNDPINFPSICNNEKTIKYTTRYGETRNFNKYGSKFLYQYKVIKEDATVSAVLDAIMKDLASIKEAFKN